MSNNHFFFAVPLPENIKSIIQELCRQAEKTLLFKRWVHEADYHITLAFLGNASLDQLEVAKSYVEESIHEVSPFLLTINELGIFGRTESPKILWLGVEESVELNKLRDIVYSKCLESGFHLDKRPFRPHITIARKWDGEDSFSLEKLQPYSIEIPSFSINKAVLYETIITKTPKYQRVELFNF